jgi:hypothetical protein
MPGSALEYRCHSHSLFGPLQVTAAKGITAVAVPGVRFRVQVTDIKTQTARRLELEVPESLVCAVLASRRCAPVVSGATGSLWSPIRADTRAVRWWCSMFPDLPRTTCACFEATKPALQLLVVHVLKRSEQLLASHRLVLLNPSQQLGFSAPFILSWLFHA